MAVFPTGRACLRTSLFPSDSPSCACRLKPIPPSHRFRWTQASLRLHLRDRPPVGRHLTLLSIVPRPLHRAGGIRKAVTISQLLQVIVQSVAGLQKTADLEHLSATDAFYCCRSEEKCRLAALCPLICIVLQLDLPRFVGLLLF